MTVVSCTDMIGQHELYTSVKYCKYVLKRHFVSRRRTDDCFIDPSEVESVWVRLFRPLEPVLRRLCVKVFFVFLTVIFLRENEGILQNTVGLLFTSHFKCSALRQADGRGVRPESDVLISLFFINIRVRILNFSDFNLKLLSCGEF